jgi:hypothetical protein
MQAYLKRIVGQVLHRHRRRHRPLSVPILIHRNDASSKKDGRWNC